MKEWKQQCNRKIRRVPIEKDLGDMGYIRKVNNRWNAPDDGRSYFDEPKFRRK